MTPLFRSICSAQTRLSHSALLAAAALSLTPSLSLAQSAPSTPSVPAQAEATSLSEDPLQYLFNRGDTLIDVARKYLRQPSDYRQLQRDNRIANPRRIPTGRNIAIQPELLRTRLDPARLESYRGDVRIERNGQPLSLSQGASLVEGDVIATGSNAFVRLSFSDGSHTVVPSNSRLRLDRLRRFIINDAPDHRLVIEQGRSESQVTPRQRPGGFRVITPTAVSAVRGTEFRVAYDEASGTTATGVLEGRVAVAGDEADNAYLVASGMGAITREGADTVTALPLLAAPALAENSNLQTTRTLSFNTLAPQGAVRVRGWIGADAGLLDPVAEIEASAGSPQLQLSDLPEGQWFLRLSALSPEGVEGRAHTFSFIRALNTVDGLQQTSETSGQLKTYRFAWRAQGEGEASFRFQLFRADQDGQIGSDNGGQPLIDSPGLTESRFSLTDLPAGTYSWRVEGLRYRYGQRLSVWSQPEILTISR